MTTVVRVNDPCGWDVYIGRANRFRHLKASVWANPFVVGRDGTRDEVIQKYRAHLLANPVLLERLPELRGKRLACWCAPQACHGDVLAEMAEAQRGGEDA